MQIDESKVLYFTEKKAKKLGCTCYISVPRKFLGKKVKVFVMAGEKYFR